MALSITVTRSWNFPAGRPVTLAALRLGALPGVSISGSVTSGDIAAGAITPALASPGAYFYGALSGTNTYAVTLNPALTAYANGVELLGKVANANTSAVVALDVNGLGAKNVYHRSGQALLPGDLPANEIVRFRYNSSRNASAGGWDIMEVLASATIRPAANVTTGTANAQAVVNVPPLTAYAAGTLLLVKVGTALTNTGALTLASDGLAARNVKRHDGTALRSQDWAAGRTYLIYDDGTQYVVLSGIAEVSDTVIIAAARNLVLVSSTNNTSLTSVDITADEIVLKTSDGRSMLATSVSNTVNITNGVALNGLETGANETASTWYYIWLISDGTNIRSVLEDGSASLNGGGDGIQPAGPDLSNAAFTGYVYKALVGQVRNSAASNFEIFCQHDRQVWTPEQVIFVGKAVAVAATAELLAGADLTAFRAAVPPNAKSCGGFVGSDNVTDDAQVLLSSCRTDGAATAYFLGVQIINIPNVAVAFDNLGACAPFNVPVRAGNSRNIEWASRVASLTVSLSISSYTF